ncbi:MAG: GNAT family N-acetyltransferase [Sporosarcina sp.]
MTVAIRKLITIEDMTLVQTLEKQVWSTTPTPVPQTFTAVKNGGLMLGAFIKDELIGFSYSFPGFKNGSSYLCSHMLGVHPDYQLMGIGKFLKEEQRTIAIEMGYDLITWTFDPLETRNAYLNTSKLFGICSIYLDNWYGEMNDGLNKGLPSDRFKIEWWIASQRVEEKWVPQISSYERPFKVGRSKEGNPLFVMEKGEIPTDCDGIEIPVPAQMKSIKQSEPELALDWRMKIRTVFNTLFSAGYALVGVSKSTEGVHYYQAVKRNTIPLKIR